MQNMNCLDVIKKAKDAYKITHITILDEGKMLYKGAYNDVITNISECFDRNVANFTVSDGYLFVLLSPADNKNDEQTFIVSVYASETVAVKAHDGKEAAKKAKAMCSFKEKFITFCEINMLESEE